MSERESYSRLWKKALKMLLGWSGQRAEKWIREQSDAFDDPTSIVYHEPPMFYIAPLLIPERLLESLTRHELRKLVERPVVTVESGETPFLPEHLAKLKQQLPLFEWLPLFEQYRQDLIANAVWLNESNVDNFDWHRARTRVEKVLEEYGERLASD